MKLIERFVNLERNRKNSILYEPIYFIVSFGFDKMSLRDKMTIFIRESSKEIKEWFYLKNMSTLIPTMWQDFKVLLSDYVCIESLKKYLKKK